MRRMRGGIADVVFGVRLLLGEGRSAWGRLLLTAVGVGFGVAVLLLAASLPHHFEGREARLAERPTHIYLATPAPAEPTVVVSPESWPYQDVAVQGFLLDQLRPEAPVPAGLGRIPAPGEVVVSPALAELLAEPGGEELRRHLPGEVVGTIGDAGLVQPTELSYYRGVDGLATSGARTYAVGDDYEMWYGNGKSTTTEEWLGLLGLGVAALLVPVVVFVASTTRLAEAARERRLANLRLLGATAAQVRRIASGEALVGALLGVLVGWLFFSIARYFAASVGVLGFSAFPEDLRPGWPLAAAITLGVPALAVGTAIVAMRRTAVEPLGVVRRTKPRSRRLGWRAVPLVLGAVLLLLSQKARDLLLLSTAVTLVLVGVAVLLPWLVERVVQRLDGVSLSWQLALRRLQMTSGSAARSVSAVAVVLTGLIALQTVVAVMEAMEEDASRAKPLRQVEVSGEFRPDGAGFAEVVEELAAIPRAEVVSSMSEATLQAGEEEHLRVAVLDCPQIVRALGPRPCADGDAFFPKAPTTPPVRRAEWTVEWRLFAPPSAAPLAWRIPDHVRTVPVEPARPERPERPDPLRWGDLLLTPTAAEGIPELARSLSAVVRFPPDDYAASVELVREVAGEHLAMARVAEEDSNERAQRILRTITYGLLLGALVVFVLIGCGLLVDAVEQVAERRQYLAVLSAVGVSRKTLVGAILLQNGLVMVVALVTAVVTGTLLGLLAVHSLGLERFRFDIAVVLALVAMAAAAVLIATMATLPALRRAVRPESLHTE